MEYSIIIDIISCKHWEYLILFLLSFGGDPDLGSSFWGMILILASTKLLTARIAAGCFIAALLIVLFVAKNVCDEHCNLFYP